MLVLVDFPARECTVQAPSSSPVSADSLKAFLEGVTNDTIKGKELKL